VAIAGPAGADPALASVSAGTAVGVTAPGASPVELMPAALLQKRAQADLSALAVRQAHAAEVARQRQVAAARKAPC
jgi:hypothetical protein